MIDIGPSLIQNTLGIKTSVDSKQTYKLTYICNILYAWYIKQNPTNNNRRNE